MNRVILIKYGELTTKKANRNLFINILCDNVKAALYEQKTNKTAKSFVYVTETI